MKLKYMVLLTLSLWLLLLSQTQAQDAFKDLTTIEAVDSVLEKYHGEGMYNEALVLAIKSEKLHKEKYGEMDTTYAKSLQTLAIIYGDVGQFKKAEEAYLNTLRIREKLLGKESQEYASTINNLGLCYYRQGKLKKAEAFFRESKGIRKRVLGEDHKDYAQSLGNLSGLYWAQGNYEESEPLLIKTLRLREKLEGKENKDYLNSLGNLASLYRNMGRLKQAESTYLEVMDLSARINGKDHPAHSRHLSNYALLNEDLKNYEKAIKLYQQAIDIIEKKQGKNNLEYGRYIMNLAAIYGKQKDYEKALPLMLENNKIIKNILGDRHPQYAGSISNLAAMYARLNQLDKAKTLMQESLDIYKEVYGVKHPQYAHGLLNMGGFYTLNGDEDKALEYLALAFEANGSESLEGKTIDEISEMMPNLEQISNTQTFQIFKEWQGAIHRKYNANMDEVWRNHFYKAIQGGMLLLEKFKNDFANDQDKLRMLNSSTYLTRRALESVTKMKDGDMHTSEVFQYAEYTKAALLSDALNSKIAMSLGNLPDSLAEFELRLDENLDKLKKLLLEEKSPERKKLVLAKINEFVQEKDAFKAKIEKEFPKYYNSKYQSHTASLEQVQAMMEDKSLVIEYVVSDTNIFAFAIQKNSSKLYNFPMIQDTLRHHVVQLRKAISDYGFIKANEDKAYKLFTTVSHWMYRLLLEQILEDVKEVEQLVIIADGSLGMIPFEVFLTALPTEKLSYSELPYLLNKYKVNYNYSATLWKENLEITDFEHANTDMFAFAASYNPEKFKNEQSWENRSSQDVRTRQGLIKLPAVVKEIKTLEEQFYGKFLYGEDAVEKTFKDACSNYGIIHLAMHGILNKKHPILSSLAFTENGDSLEDNFLQAAEIAHLKLNAQLVVLSACETGYGSYQLGEGILSLARSFMYAGVPAMVVSLWQVNDNSTAVIMKSLYANMAKGMNKATALQQAKLDYIKKAKSFSAHPAFWAPFIQIGDNRPLNIHQKGGFNWTWAAVGGAVLLLLGGLFVRSRAAKSRA